MAIQLTKAQQDELLQTILGEPVEVVDANDSYDINDYLSKVDANRKPYIRATTQEEDKEAGRIEATGRMTGAQRSLLKRLTGYDGKHDKWEEFVEKALEHAKTMSGASKEEYLKQIQDMADAKDREKEEALKEWENKYNTIQKKYLDRDATESLRMMLKDMTLEGDKGVHASDLYRALNDAYTVQYDETSKEIKLFNKENPSLPATNSKNTQLVSIADYAKDYFTTRGALKTDTRGKNPMDEMNKRHIDTAPPIHTKQPSFNDVQRKILEMGIEG